MIKIGVIGTGIWGSLHLTALKDREINSGDIELSGFAELDTDIRNSREKEFHCKGYSNYKDMIENDISGKEINSINYQYHRRVYSLLRLCISKVSDGDY